MLSKNTEALIVQLKERDVKGLRKYGVSLDRDDMDVGQWLQHLQEELLDAAAYIEGLKQKHREDLTPLPAEIHGRAWSIGCNANGFYVSAGGGNDAMYLTETGRWRDYGPAFFRTHYEAEMFVRRSVSRAKSSEAQP